jgi:hypothetical protein
MNFWKENQRGLFLSQRVAVSVISPIRTRSEDRGGISANPRSGVDLKVGDHGEIKAKRRDALPVVVAPLRVVIQFLWLSSTSSSMLHDGDAFNWG